MKIIINKKGITPVIAVVLLMMMTVAAAGAAYIWILSVQSTVQTDTSDFISDTLERKDFLISDVECDYDASDGAGHDNITIVLYNNGKSDFNSEDVWIFLLNATTGQTIQSKQYDAGGGSAITVSLSKEKTTQLEQDQFDQMAASTDYTIKVVFGGVEKEKACTSSAS